jgi:hypothetical protein
MRLEMAGVEKSPAPERTRNYLAGIIKHAADGLITSGASQRAIPPVPTMCAGTIGVATNPEADEDEPEKEA